jgi:hypothetical protein
MKFLFSVLSFVCLIQGVFAQNDILVNIPKEVKAGNEFIAVVSLPKGQLHGVSRLQLKLPNGFSATERNSAQADFKFENQKVSFFWLNYPENLAIELSFNVSVSPTIEGYFVFKGEANWMDQKEPFRTEIYPQVITIKAGDKSEEELLQSLEKTRFKYDVLETEGINCLRQVPFAEDGAIIVNLLINKGDLNKYGKIQEKIPMGYKVENLKSQNAIFVYNERQNIVKYMWMSMPAKPRFVVSYKLIPTNKVDDSNPFLIVGSFYYAENNQTTSVDIQERGIVISTDE